MPSSAPAVPLSVLDLVPISSGGSAAGALRNTVELARSAEEFGYHRYWLAEHHLAPGVAGTSPELLIQLVAQATEHIRVGSGAVQLGHRTALSVVEQFGILDALHPGRIDLGLGRSGGRGEPGARREEPETAGTFTDSGLYVPPRFTGWDRLLDSPAHRLAKALLQQPGAHTPDYAGQVRDILDLIAGGYRTPEGTRAHPVPGEGAGVAVWVLGSSGGISAEAAGANGLPFAANYHVSPGTVLEAVAAYRAAFRPGALAEPYVVVSADVVVGPDDDSARELASPYGLWVRSIRTGRGARPFPTPQEAAAHQWSAQDRALVADRVETQFVGAPETVTERLRALQEATGADELLITTITHGHADRVRSYELLAHAWCKQA